MTAYCLFFFFFSSRRRHTRFDCDWSSDVCSSDLGGGSPGWRACRRGLSLPLRPPHAPQRPGPGGSLAARLCRPCARRRPGRLEGTRPARAARQPPRSEEHTSELQSQSNLVCRLLLEKKKKKTQHTHNY